jgi:TonB family protein
MPDNILVIEYEPRYAERLRQVLTQESFAPTFVKDGEVALRAILDHSWQLIVLSSVTPKVSAADLVREIRTLDKGKATPVLLTVSGYKGSTPKADALRFGASDLLAKPYSDEELLAKINGLLGTSAVLPPKEAEGVQTRMPSPPAIKPGEAPLTSTDIFGDLLDESASPVATPKRPPRPADDVDKMLADTLSGVRQPQRKKEADKLVPAGLSPAGSSSPASSPGGSPAAGSSRLPTPGGHAVPARSRTEVELEKLLSETMSGREKRPRTRADEPVPPPPAVPLSASQPPSSSQPAAASVQPSSSEPAAAPPAVPSVVRQEKVAISSPILTAPLAPESKVDEADDSDGVRFGQYVLIEKIATGGMAEVWKARMRGVEGFQKIVAIKKILPHLSDNQEFVDMFIDEAKFAAQLNHNNIIHIYDLGKISGSYYIAMEYVDGGDLKSIISRGESSGHPLTVELALFIASKIASALDYAHRKRDFDEKEMGLVHRDVSPQNVLVSHDGDIKLCDFGIAKAASKASHTHTGALKGKLQYMSPEQAWGKPIDRRSDVFALGTVLYEMITSSRLFGGDSEISILEQVREARVPPPSRINDEVPPEVDRIVLKALEKDADARYQTAGEMAREIDAVLYTFRPTPTSADLAIHMNRIHSDQPAPPPSQHFDDAADEPTAIDDGPGAELAPVVAIGKTSPPTQAVPRPPVVAPVVQPVVSPITAPIPASERHHDVVPSSPLTVPEKKRSMLPAIIAVVVLAGAAGAYFMFRGGGERPAAPQATTTVPASPIPNQPPQTVSAQPGTAALTTSPTTGSAVGTPNTASVPAAPVVDTARVDAEVQRRMAAEKARLQQQAAPARSIPVPVAVPPRAQPPAAPLGATASTSTVQERPAVTVSQTPAPPPVEPAAETPAQPARAHEGDLVPPGTEGLSPPRIIKHAPVSYPRAARIEHVEGTVILSVLVSETGKVLDVKTLRGVNRGGGLNEAAVDCMRRSTFAPGTKDGVNVKSYVTVPIDFKL